MSSNLRYRLVLLVTVSCLCAGGTVARAEFEDAKLVPTDVSAGDEFGRGASVSGDVAVFGAFKQECGDGANCGAAYVYRWDGTDWGQEQKLIPEDIQAGSFFGDSAGVSGNVIVVGNPTAGSALYVFRWNGTSWFEEAKLEADDATSGQLGISSSIDGDIAVGGAPLDSQAGTWAGAVYVFRRAGGVWQQEVKLIASDAEAGDQFGIAVSVEGNRIVVGSARDDDACPTDPECNSGAVYVFHYDGANWVEEAKLVAIDAAASDGLGFETQLSGNRVVVGSIGDDPAGSAYVFRRDGTTWVQEAKLTASDGEPGDQFGFVSIHGDTVLVGAPGVDDACPTDPGCTNAGAGYLFRRNGMAWNQVAKFTASDAAAGDLVGWIKSVAVGAQFAVLAATLEDENGEDSGAVYAYLVAQQPVPTVSSWGLAILTLLLLAAGKVYFGRRRHFA